MADKTDAEMADISNGAIVEGGRLILALVSAANGNERTEIRRSLIAMPMKMLVRTIGMVDGTRMLATYFVCAI